MNKIETKLNIFNSGMFSLMSVLRETIPEIIKYHENAIKEIAIKRETLRLKRENRKQVEDIITKKENKKQTKFKYDSGGYTINTTPKL